MRPLRYSINVTLDGCCDHRVGIPDEETHRYWAAELERADALLFGRVTFEMMEAAWRQPATGAWPDWMADWMIPFARTIDGAKKYVVSDTLERVDWNAELLRGDLEKAVQQPRRRRAWQLRHDAEVDTERSCSVGRSPRTGGVAPRSGIGLLDGGIKLI